MAWPCRRGAVGRPARGGARASYAGVAQRDRALRAGDDGRRPAAAPPTRARRCGADVEVVELPIDDSWMRDSGPIVVTGDGRRTRAGVHFGFNAWGEKFAPVRPRRRGRRGCSLEHLGIAARRGAVRARGRLDRRRRRGHAGHDRAVPAATRTATRRCARRDRGGAARVARRRARSCGSADGLAEDGDTDGHVDNVVRVHRARRACCCRPSTTADNPNHARSPTTTARRLGAAGLDVGRVRPCCRTLESAATAGRRCPT